MKVLYIDESGGAEPEGSSSSATPLMVIAGLVVDDSQVSDLTGEFVRIKQAFYPGSMRSTARVLDYILAEVKGTDVRKELRQPGRDASRHAIGFLNKVVDLLEATDARILGRFG